MPISAEADMSDNAGLPADAGFDPQVALIRPIAQHLDVTDMRDASDLCSCILQQPLLGIGFTDNAREGR